MSYKLTIYYSYKISDFFSMKRLSEPQIYGNNEKKNRIKYN